MLIGSMHHGCTALTSHDFSSFPFFPFSLLVSPSICFMKIGWGCSNILSKKKKKDQVAAISWTNVYFPTRCFHTTQGWHAEYVLLLLVVLIYWFSCRYRRTSVFFAKHGTILLQSWKSMLSSASSFSHFSILWKINAVSFVYEIMCYSQYFL